MAATQASLITQVGRLSGKALQFVFWPVIPSTVRMIVRRRYNALADLDTEGKYVFLNYGYAETDGSESPTDGKQSSSVELYRQVVSSLDLKDKDVVEIGSGRGGGAAYVKQTFQPQSLIGIDLNAKLVRFCNNVHKVPGLEFREGGAEAIPLPDESADVVVNVESSHCYADFPRFVREVHRILRPGGHFAHTDFRDDDKVDAWRESLCASGLEIIHEEDITANVLQALDNDNDMKIQAIQEHMPKKIHKVMGDMGALVGTDMYNWFKDREVLYKRFVLQKPEAADIGKRLPR